MKKRRKPVLVGVVGLVGSGKSTVAKEFARHLKAKIVWQDGIRLMLRRKHGSYRTTEVDDLASRVAEKALSSGMSVIDDGDAVSVRNQKRLAVLAKRHGARLVFIRVVCNPDITFGRIVAERRSNAYFAGAASPFKGEPRIKAAAVKLRELWRRTPLHYTWSIPRESSRWTLKRLPHHFTAVIDTTHPGWKREVPRISRVILQK